MFSTFSVPAASSRSRSETARGRACDVCRKFKIKCETERAAKASDQSNPCIPCKKARVKCTYNDKPAKRGRPWKQSRIPTHTVTSVPRAHDHTSSPESLAANDASSVQPTNNSKAEERPDESHPGPSTTLASVSLATPVSCIVPSTPSHTVPIEASQDHPRASPNLQYEEHVWSILNNFFETMYLIFPIVSYDALVSKVALDLNWRLDPDFRTLLYALNLFNVSADHRMQRQDPSELTVLARQVERSRLCYDFADPATLNSVVVSLSLFTAYNVLEKHNRAFLYLHEAITLFEAVPGPLSEAEESRKHRLGQVLFNTESATLAIYATDPGRRLQEARKPYITGERPSTSMTWQGPERHAALYLLDQLTRIHLAEDADQMTTISVEADPSQMMPAPEDTSPGQLRYWRLQSADVAITLQWQLSRMLLGISSYKPSSGASPRYRTSHLGVTAISHIYSLSEGDLRIVGLGKVAGLALNLSMLANCSWQQDVLRGLTNAVLREDYEGTFGFLLDSLIVPTIPTGLPSPQMAELSRWWDFNAPTDDAFTAFDDGLVVPGSGFVEETENEGTQELVSLVVPTSSTSVVELKSGDFEWPVL